MRLKAAAVNAAGVVAGGVVGAKLTGALGSRLPGSLSLYGSSLGSLVLGGVLGMLSKRGLVQELAHGSIVGGMAGAALMLLATRTPGGA